MQLPEKQNGFPWGDAPWLAHRAKTDLRNTPVNIYEVHLGSWRRGRGGAPLPCGEIARLLVPYAKQMGFTHVHLLPVARHAPGDQWGYDCTDGWTPDPRIGTARELMALVDALHRAGVGVFLDWVCPSVPPEELTACALHWIDTYHLDGLRPVYAPGCPPAPLERLHKELSARRPDVCVMGFGAARDTKFNWVSPFASFDPSTPSILAFSHDEAARASLLSRMDGDEAARFAAVRVFYTRLLALPAKSLLMMGSEFGQPGPWRCEHSLDWHLTEQPGGEAHRRLSNFFRAAGDCYLRTAALWELDDSPDGFRPLYDANGISAFLRADRRGNAVLAVFNLSDRERPDISLGVPRPGRYTALLRTDAGEFGGEGRLPAYARSSPVPLHGMEQSVTLGLPPISAVLLKCPRKNQSEKVFP